MASASAAAAAPAAGGAAGAGAGADATSTVASTPVGAGRDLGPGRGGEVRVLVASTAAMKLDAARAAFATAIAAMYPTADAAAADGGGSGSSGDGAGSGIGGAGSGPAPTLVVTGVKAPSGVSEQPKGNAETLTGARNRAAWATRASEAAAAHYVVAIENGVVRAVAGEGGTGGDGGDGEDGEGALWMDVAWVVVRDVSTGSSAVAQGVGLPFPTSHVRNVLESHLAAYGRREPCDVTVGSILAERTGCHKQDPHAQMTAGLMPRALTLQPAILAALGQLLAGNVDAVSAAAGGGAAASGST